MRSARACLRSTATARLAGSASIHSIATLPEPAPRSHNSSPRRGASALKVSARMARLVICPSCSNQSSGSPGARGMIFAARRRLDLERDRVQVGDVVGHECVRPHRALALARAAHRLERRQPRGAKAALRQKLAQDAPACACPRTAPEFSPSAAAPEGSPPAAGRAATRIASPAAQSPCARRRAKRRRARETPRVRRAGSCAPAASRRRRRTGRRWRAPPRRARASPRGRAAHPPAARASAACGRRAARRGAGGARRRRQVRLAPSRAAAAGERPSRPSSPMPMIASQAVMEFRLGRHTRAHSRGNRRSARAVRGGGRP